jgi:hypothetical protein
VEVTTTTLTSPQCTRACSAKPGSPSAESRHSHQYIYIDIYTLIYMHVCMYIYSRAAPLRRSDITSDHTILQEEREGLEGDGGGGGEKNSVR